MKTKTFALLAIGLVCAIFAVTLMAAPAHSRPLTQAEMRATVGKIGDGCPCAGVLTVNCDTDDDNCTGKICLSVDEEESLPWLSGCSDVTFYVKEGSDNTAYPCHALGTPDKTCHGSALVECDYIYACTSSDIIDDKTCSGHDNTCTVTDTSKKCRHCVSGGLINTKSYRNQTCPEN